MPRLDRLPETNRNSLLTLPVPINDGAPYTSLTKPLSACRIALVTTAGLHLRDDHPFVGGDQSYRVIPSTTAASAILQSHTSIGFDRVPIQRDLNVSFPIDRLREMADGGEVGSLATNFYSFMGAQRDWTRMQSETVPEVGRALRSDDVDVVFMTPT